MKKLIPVAAILLLAACSNSPEPKLGMEADQPTVPTGVQAAPAAPALALDTLVASPAVPAIHGGEHPISLQWISWDKKGSAKVIPADSGWYHIDGTQRNAEVEYLSITGRIRRVSAKELAFEGTVQTRTNSNFGGQPCFKQGPQRFFAKRSRTYYRLQDMDNCMGENVVDYIDIYPGTSSL